MLSLMPTRARKTKVLLTDLAKPEMVPTRDGYGKGVLEAGEKDPRVVVLCADLTESTRCHWFAEKFPERFIQVGVAEQNLAVVGSGLAAAGKIPFIASYATFSPGRNNEQIRTNIAINDRPVKVVGAHAGISVGPDGATHQALEDIALMRVIPRMVVVVPCDAIEARKATLELAFNGRPSYLRVGREKSAVVTTEETPFEVGKALELRAGKDCAIVACGIMVYEALKAAQTLADEGIECAVIDNHTIKPLDEDALEKAARATGAVVTAEEHQVAGGMGSAVAEALARRYPVPMEFVGMQDRFGESGEAAQLMEHFGLSATAIAEAVKRAIARKGKKK
jgi:transketolase